jgi:hypothetical protein
VVVNARRGRPRGPGVGRIEKVEVTYRSGGTRHREVFDHSIIMCAPEEEYFGPNAPKHCDEKAAGSFGSKALG